jgi:hypothetical protein
MLALGLSVPQKISLLLQTGSALGYAIVPLFCLVPTQVQNSLASRMGLEDSQLNSTGVCQLLLYPPELRDCGLILAEAPLANFVHTIIVIQQRTIWLHPNNMIMNL